VGLAAALGYGLYRVEESRFERDGLATARAGALAIEREIQGVIATAEVLATSPALQAGDLQTFDRQAKAAVVAERDSQITLRDLDSRQLVNSLLPWGEAPPNRSSLAAYDQEVLRTGKPAVADHFVGIVGRTSQTAVVVPVRRDGQIVYLLSIALHVERLRGVLRDESDDFWRMAAIDRGGTVVTRTRNPDTPGARAPEPILAAARQADRGFVRFNAVDGTPSVAAFARTSFGWIVASGVTLEQYRTGLRTALGLLTFGSVLLVLLAIGGAWLLARRISAPILALEQAGGQLLRGEAISRPLRATREVDAVAKALAEAGAELRSREADLAASKARFENLFRSMDEGFFVVELVRDAEGQAVDYRFLLANSAFERATGLVGVAGRMRSEVLEPESLWWMPIYDGVARDGTPAHFEYQLRSNGRWFEIHATRMPGAVDQVAIVSNDITDRKAAAAEREQLLAAQSAQREFLEGIVRHAPIGIAVLVGPDLVVELVNPAFQAILGPGVPIVGRPYRDSFKVAALAGAEERMRLVLSSGEPWQVRNYQTPSDTAAHGRWWEGEVMRLPEADNGKLLVLIWEITERKQAERTRELLLNELNHRVKNTLTAVQSMAMQTLRGDRTLREARDALVERLMALSRAHNILTEESWSGANLQDVVRQAVKPFEREDARLFTISGPDLRVSPKVALALSLGLHELCTNALKYGALTRDTGRILIAWSVTDGRLELRWRETGGPAPGPGGGPSGFGTRLLRRSIEDDLGGTIGIYHEPEGLTCAIAIAIDAP
jgi:two-component sensor histidine kinase